MTHYIIQTASAKMPTTCWGKYRRVAVLEVEGGIERVSMISPRARGVRRIVETWERLNVGRSPRCAYARALRQAEELVAKLTAELTESDPASLSLKALHEHLADEEFGMTRTEVEQAVREGRDLRGAFGDVDLRGAFGDVDLRGAFGDVDLRGAFGDVDLRGAFGDVDLRGAFGDGPIPRP